MNCIKTTAITVTGNTLVLTIPSMTLINAERFRVCMAQKVPSFTGILNVAIKVGSNAYTVITRCVPNNLYTDQLKQCCNGDLKSRQALDVVFATDTLCFLYDGCRLPCTNKVMPVIEPKVLEDEKIV